MIKLILFAAIAFAIYKLWLHIQKLKTQANQHDNTNRNDAKITVQCNYCNAYIPQDNAIRNSDGKWYCCIDHLKKMEH